MQPVTTKITLRSDLFSEEARKKANLTKKQIKEIEYAEKSGYTIHCYPCEASFPPRIKEWRNHIEYSHPKQLSLEVWF